MLPSLKNYLNNQRNKIWYRVSSEGRKKPAVLWYSKSRNSRHNLRAGHMKQGLGFFKTLFPSLLQYFNFY